MFRPILLLSSTVVVLAAGCGRSNGLLQSGPTMPGGDQGTTAPSDMGHPSDGGRTSIRSWEWVNPQPSANPLRAVAGTSADDIWMVGDVGTLLHWDGANVTVARSGAPADSFIAVAANATNDVWVAGRSSGGSLLHWDGTAWSSAYAIAAMPIHGLAASANGNVYAAVEDSGRGEVWGDTGTGWWNLTYRIPTAVLRDVFAAPHPGAADSDLVFGVGDKGAVAWGPSWGVEPGTPSAGGGASDPFSSDKNYFGVWGATANDVWAGFRSGTTLGFSHFDGKAWKVAQTVPNVSCLPPPGPYDDPPFDRGKRLVGLDATHILAIPPTSGFCSPFEWNGTTWAQRPVGYSVLEGPSLAGIDHRWYAVTSKGELEVSNSDLTWTELPGPTSRDGVWHVSLSEDDAIWGTLLPVSTRRASQPQVWSGGTWQTSSTPAVSDGSEVVDVWALGASDVWAVGMQVAPSGRGTQGTVMHWDGQSWSMPEALPNSHRLTSVWADRADDVWVAGWGDPNSDFGESCVVYRFDGKSWTALAVPPHPIGVQQPAIGGLGPNAIWITTFVASAEQYIDRRAVWKWDGTSIQEVAWVPNRWGAGGLDSIGRPWATSENDVWIPAQPVMHWDGSSWSTSAAPPPDVNISAIYGTSPDDVWGVGTGPFGGAIWHLENGRFVSVLDTAVRLFDIRGSQHRLPWVVGENGATLRLVEHPAAP